MSGYLHILPGRLRLRCPVIRDEGAARAVRRRVLAIPGVASAATNTATGSLLVTYDPERLDVAELWARLAALGYAGAAPASAAAARRDLAGTLVDLLLRGLAEHSAAALLRAVL